MVRFGLLTIVALCVAGSAMAADLPPDMLIRDSAKEVFEAFRKDKKVQAGDEKRAVAVIQARVLPHFDFPRMTRLAASKYWLSASEEQKQALTREFQNLLTRTYVNQIVMMSDKSVEVRPVKLRAGETDVSVKATLTQPGSPPLAIDFSLWKSPQGWRIYDVAVENMSGVNTYRSIFAAEIQRGGIDGLIRSLSDKNRAAAPR